MTEPACAPEVTAASRATAIAALTGLFIDQDVSAIDEYWADPYLQHNPVASSGVAAFRSFFGNTSTLQSLDYSLLRVVADCDLVVVHGHYGQTGFIFDMFRVADEHLVEHWDSDSGQGSDGAGPAEPSASASGAESKAVVLQLFEAGLIAGNMAQVTDSFSANFVDHRRVGQAGPDPYVAALASEQVQYSKVHYALGEGDMVFILSEGTRAGTAYGFYDLFRVEDGKIVERWDSRRAVPAMMQGRLPIF